MNALRWILMVSVPVAAVGAWFLLPPSEPSDPPGGEQARNSQAAKAERVDATGSPTPNHRPDAVVESSEFNFGAMDSLQSGSHSFTIHNRGDVPLQLRDGGTTCKCTLSEVPVESVLPGKSAQVTLNWLTTSSSNYYSQTAHVLTNDPKNRHIELRVFGTIRNRVVVEPSAIVFSKVEPDSTSTADALVFSELWHRFEIQDVSCSLPGFRWEITPVAMEQEQSDQRNPRSCYRIRLTCPDDLPQGHFNGVLAFRIIPATPGAEPQACELAVNGKVVRRLSVYGQAVNSAGEVELDTVARGQSREVSLLMKVRDAEKTLPVERIEVEPKFVNVVVESDSEEAARRGLYRMRIRIPADAPECEYLSERLGRLRLVIDHPRIPELTLKLKFAVVGGLQARRPPSAGPPSSRPSRIAG